MKKIIILFFCFYFFALLQASFFPHFPFGHLLTPTPIFGGGLNLVLIVVVLINLFEARKEKSGLFSAFFGGFFLDIFSENFIGFWILILLAISIFIKFVLRKHVRFPIFKPR